MDDLGIRYLSVKNTKICASIFKIHGIFKAQYILNCYVY